MPTTPFYEPFNEGWTVQRPTGPFAALTGEASDPQPVVLPHDAMRDTTRTGDAPSGPASGYHPGGAWRYVRAFHTPESWRGRWVALEFDGAYRDALVYVNGALVAHRPNGYARFFAEIGPFLAYGADNEVRVEVRVHKDSRWYTGAGLYRGVGLWVAGGVHVAPDGVAVITPDVDADLATVEVVATLINDSHVLRTVQVATTILDPDGAEVATLTAPATVLPGEPAVVRHRVFVRTPRMWSPDSPSLYAARTLVSDGDETPDGRMTAFGVRTVTVDPVRGLRLNGEPVKLRGACIHHDNGPLGAVSLPAAEERRIAGLKAAGFNAVRMAHHHAGQALLDACDRLGMLVMNEAYDVWTVEKSEFDGARSFPEWWARDVESLVLGSRNHPSVILYSIGNEIPELGNPSGAHVGRRIAEHLRALDPTRPVTNGINVLLAVDLRAIIAQAGGLNALMGGGGPGEEPGADAAQAMAEGMSALAASSLVGDAIAESASMLDVVGYNYAESRFEADAVAFPHRVVVGSETFPTQIAANWALVQRFPHVLGDFTWTGWDYLGEAGVGGAAYAEVPDHVPGFEREFPFLTAYVGDIDITGFRRPASYYREIMFGLRREPYIAVQRPEHHGHTRLAVNAWGWSDSVSSWNWPGYEGKPVIVEVYADADEVELLLDGESIGRTPVGASRPHTALFETTYRPGTLTAVAHEDGQPARETVLHSAEGPPRLVLRPERATITAAEALLYVPVSLEDAHGVVATGQDRAVSVSVSGPAVVAGFASGDPRTEERFDATTRTTWDGRALIVLRATGTGLVTVTASSPGLADATVDVTIRD